MAVVSSTVNSGELATATQFNNLRTDAVGSTGHDHGSGQGNATISATTFDGTATVSGAWNFTGAVGIDSSVDADVTDFDLASSGDIDLASTNNAAGAITLHANGGTTETIKIHADQGTSVTEGAESITILSDAGGVGIRSTANLANAVNLTVDGGTTSTMTLFNDQGTAATEGAASIQLLSDVGGINVKSGLNASNAILLTADGGTSETIVIHADQGTGTGSIELLSDAGGIELDAGTDIILDAGGADIFLKDDGTLFGTLTNSSGELVIKSSSSGTTAATFSGANVTLAGTVGSGAITSSGIIKTDDTTEATSTTDGSLQTDGGLSIAKDAVFGDDIKLLSDSAVIALGADGDTTLTHTDGTGLTLNSTNKLTFGDAASFVQQSADGTLRIDGEAIIDLNASTRVDVSAALTVGTDVNIGDDLSLTSDSAVLNMGAGNDFTITHDGTTGATLAGNPITITSGGAATWSSSAGALTITSAAAATWSTAAGALTIDGDDGITLQTTGSGNVTVSEILDITDATDSSDATGDTGALRTEGGASIAKKLYVGTDLDVDGTANLDAVDIDGAVQIDEAVTVGVDDTGREVVFHGATANAELRWDESADGLILNQGTSDEKILSLKGSDINTGFTSGTNKTVEVTDFATFTKRNATHGGLQIQAMAADAVTNNVLRVHAYGGQANTAKTTGAEGLIHFQVAESDGSNALANIEGDGNVFVVTGYVGGSHLARFVVDEDGELLAASATVGTFDEYDDAHLVRALDQTKGDVIRGKWDDYVQYNEQSLVDAGILGASVAEGGLLNVTGLQRLHNGAIWQGYVKQQEMQERIDTLENKLLALEAK